MTRIENIGTILTGVGLLGAILFADTLDTSLRTFIICETPCVLAILFGAFLYNTSRAGAEAPATNTMKRGESRNS